MATTPVLKQKPTSGDENTMTVVEQETKIINSIKRPEITHDLSENIIALLSL